MNNLNIKYAMLIYRLKRRIHQMLIKILPLCHGHVGPCFKIGKRRRQNTQYVDDSKNWVFLCDDCMRQNDEHWDEMWDDYYSSRF